eukprot:2052931-Pyramimonas_sp.AAC.1
MCIRDRPSVVLLSSREKARGASYPRSGAAARVARAGCCRQGPEVARWSKEDDVHLQIRGLEGQLLDPPPTWSRSLV